MTLLSQAQPAVGQELGLGSGGTALPLLMRAAARAPERIRGSSAALRTIR